MTSDEPGRSDEPIPAPQPVDADASGDAAAAAGAVAVSRPTGAAPRPPAPTREYRATVTFAIAATFGVVIFLIGAGLGPQLLALVPLAIMVVIGTIAIYGIEAYGLSNRSDWARYAMTAMLWILLIQGVIQFFVELSRSSINIPIGSLLAAWALSAPPDARLGPVPASSGAGLLLIILSVVGSILPFIGG